MALAKHFETKETPDSSSFCSDMNCSLSITVLNLQISHENILEESGWRKLSFSTDIDVNTILQRRICMSHTITLPQFFVEKTWFY